MKTAALPLLAQLLRTVWHSHTLHGTALRRYHDARAQRLVVWVAQHSPFYRQHWQGYCLSDWRNLPTVTKPVLLAHFAGWNTADIAYAQAHAAALAAETANAVPVLRAPDGTPLVAGRSSGTSGQHGIFLVSPGERAAWAGMLLALLRHHVVAVPLRVLLCLRAGSALYGGVTGRLLRLRYLPLSLPLAAYCAMLHHYQPHVLLAPPSLLVRLAQAYTAGVLRHRPARVVAVAELLEAHDAAVIAAAFGCAVAQVYQATEGLLAITCPHGRLHLNESGLVFQFVPVPHSDGSRHLPIVTDLWRTTQPLVRYRLDDVLVLAPATARCPCGQAGRMVWAHEGRLDDVVYLVTATGQRRAWFASQLAATLWGAHPALRDYRVYHAVPGHLQLVLALDRQSDSEPVIAAVRRTVMAAARALGAVPPTLTIRVGEVPVSPTEKVRRVQARPTHSPHSPVSSTLAPERNDP